MSLEYELTRFYQRLLEQKNYDFSLDLLRHILSVRLSHSKIKFTLDQCLPSNKNELFYHKLKFYIVLF